MNDELRGVIAQLERQRMAIDNALSALREIFAGTATPAESGAGTMTKRRGRRKAAAPAAAPMSPVRKAGITAEGRERLAAAMRRRWAMAKAAGTSPNKPVAKTGRARRAA